jgi:hypothetical protein
MAIIKMTQEEYKQKFGSLPDVKPIETQEFKNRGVLTAGDPLRDFGIGFGKKTLSTLQNIGNIIAKPVGRMLGVEESQVGIPEDKLELKGTAQKVGGVASDIVGLVAGGAGVSGMLPRAITSGLTVAAQEGEVGKESAIAAGTEVALPVVGKYVAKPIMNITARLTKSLASKLSGVSSQAIDEIIENPEVAKQVASQIDKTGQREILTKNVDTVIQGVRRIKNEARSAFGKGLDQLKKTDINPKSFRDSVQSFLDSYGISIKNGKRVLDKIEFDDPKNIEKAKLFVSRLNNLDFDGASIRKFADDIESARYKIASSDERLAFNAFLNDLSGSLKESILKSTDKLGEINAKFSKDMQLAQAVEDIFGKVKFGGNLSELRKAALKMETLFSRKGIDPEIVDDFLKRIDIQPEVLRTREAVRQISGSISPKNPEGVTISELTSGLSGAIIPPQKVRDIAIKVGLAENTIKSVLEKVAPTARASVVKLLAGFAD